MDVAAFQDFKVSLLPRACEDFARVYRKVKKIIIIIAKFEFRLNCKERLMFYQGPIIDNNFMSVDAAQLFFV